MRSPAKKTTKNTSVKADVAAHKPAAPKAEHLEATAATANVVATESPAVAAVKVITPEEDTRYRKKDLLDKVSKKTGMRKNEIRPIMDAILAEMGEALCDDAEMVLQPFGKLMVKRSKDLSNATVYTCRIRRLNGQPNVTLAESSNDAE
ncbi:HU family DNA-binding protein [Halocynthiibacter namhaensis]|uniref:HU family DNA-binding protein n=1 Tax=Halocynthiibacter namhaensis TaxID=1290553 RepID=UPI00068DFE56|nr:HU family DNA-binding protein [Halocynthiibacter namhaensis]